MNNMSDILSQYDANLQAIIAEYKSFGQMRMAQVLSAVVRERIQAEVTRFVQAKKQQLDAASKLLVGLDDFATLAQSADPFSAVTDAVSTPVTQATPLIDLGSLPPPDEPVLTPPAPSPIGVVRIATEDEWDNPSSPVDASPPAKKVRDEPQVELGHNRHKDRPKPRRSQGSAVSAKGKVPIQRSVDAPDDAPDDAPVATPRQERKIRKIQRNTTGMAAIASVSAGDIKSDAVGGLTGTVDSTSDPSDVIRTKGSRSADPDGESNDNFDRVVQRTRRMQAEAKMAKSEHPDSVLLISEARIIDSEGSTVGRASRIYKSGKQIEIDEVEMYLGDGGLGGDWSSEIALADGESIWRNILKRREIFEFRGSDKVLSASLGSGRLLGFDDGDENVLIIEEVILTKTPEAVGGAH